MENDQNKLEQFLNNLEGEVVSIIPNIKRTSSYFKFMVLLIKSIFCLLSKKLNSSYELADVLSNHLLAISPVVS